MKRYLLATGIASLLAFTGSAPSSHAESGPPIPFTPKPTKQVNLKTTALKPLKPLSKMQVSNYSPPAQTPVYNALKPRSGNTGNTYSYGWCTWYVKNMRPDIPNTWGNADTWFYRARAMGWPTGSTPRVGAIGQQGMHVVYITGISGSNVTLSEMNYVGWNIASTRTAPASSFNYIY